MSGYKEVGRAVYGMPGADSWQLITGVGTVPAHRAQGIPIYTCAGAITALGLGHRTVAPPAPPGARASLGTHIIPPYPTAHHR